MSLPVTMADQAAIDTSETRHGTASFSDNNITENGEKSNTELYYGLKMPYSITK